LETETYISKFSTKRVMLQKPKPLWQASSFKRVIETVKHVCDVKTSDTFSMNENSGGKGERISRLPIANRPVVPLLRLPPVFFPAKKRRH